MNPIFILTTIIYLIFPTPYNNLGAKITPEIKNGQTYNEKFEDFLLEFCFNEKFQKERVKFPFMYVHYNEQFTSLDTSYIQEKDWIFRQLFCTPENNSFSQIYDNFNHELTDTNERVFAWYGIGNGIKDFLYFQRINGLWYLLKEEDLST